MNLIKNEYIKLGFKKQIISFLVLTLIIILNYYINEKNLTMDNVLTIIPFIGIIISILFSGTISHEIQSGTFRFYLTKSISRNKVFISKLLTMILFTIEMLIYCLIIHIILKVKLENVNNFLINSSSLLLILTIIMLLSTIIKNQSITSGISIILLTFSNTITELLLSKNIKIIKYTFIPYIDLNLFTNNTIDIINKQYDVNLTIKFGLIMLFIYSLLFIIIGLKIFNKKDI